MIKQHANAKTTSLTPVAVVTGGSKGIGAACCKALSAKGFLVGINYRGNAEKAQSLLSEMGEKGFILPADMSDIDDVEQMVKEIKQKTGRVDVLVNNAGGARGLDPIADADIEHWRWMWESNVLGTLLVTRALLPKLIDSGDGLIVTVTSIAAVEIYDNGGGYTSAKHAQGVLHRTLRSELLGKPVRLTEIAPGMVQTDFSLNRFEGDEERAAKVYEGVTPLVAEDIAEVIGFVASRPSHVDLDLIVVRPRDQVSGASGSRFNRR